MRSVIVIAVMIVGCAFMVAAYVLPDPTEARIAQDLEVRDQLLEKFSPIFVWDEGDKEEQAAVVSLVDYADGCTIRTPKGWLDDGKSFTAKQLIAKIKETPSGESAAWELKPSKNILRKTPGNSKAIQQGRGIFGRATERGQTENALICEVSYYLFLTWNVTAYDKGEGNHEGDWIAVDFQVYVPNGDVSNAYIMYGLFHNHGRVLLVDKKLVEMDKEEKRPLIYLERGTNEPWPNAGGRGFNGWPDGVKTTKLWPCGEGLESEYKVVREHRGSKVKYDTHKKVKNLDGSPEEDDEIYLFREYRGQWGEYDDDDYKWLHGQDATNPRSPRWNEKMWKRNFVPEKHANDPLKAAEAWTKKPDCK